MMEPRRLLALAAALNLTVCAGAASAQTVIVRNAPPDSAVEVVLNDTRGRNWQDQRQGRRARARRHVRAPHEDRDRRPDIRRYLPGGPPGARRRARGAGPLQETGCTRRDMGGIFVVKAISSLVMDVGGPSPTLLLRQGKVSLDPPRVWKPAPTGLVLFGGGAFTKVGDVTATACGSVTPLFGRPGRPRLLRSVRPTG